MANREQRMVTAMTAMHGEPVVLDVHLLLSPLVTR